MSSDFTLQATAKLDHFREVTKMIVPTDNQYFTQLGRLSDKYLCRRNGTLCIIRESKLPEGDDVVNIGTLMPKEIGQISIVKIDFHVFSWQR